MSQGGFPCWIFSPANFSPSVEYLYFFLKFTFSPAITTDIRFSKIYFARRRIVRSGLNCHSLIDY